MEKYKNMEKDNKKKVAKNRDEIHNFLSADLPLDIIYFNVRRLAAQNERLTKLKK